ncbi:hypothetical protein BD779DRAFT_1672642 [Infundibulicybe gibba]|nr:hypothetical protein BD779DRAFT_1672642 [Infundibulicybe gibba]
MDTDTTHNYDYEYHHNHASTSVFAIPLEQILDDHDGDVEWEWAHPPVHQVALDSDTDSTSDSDSDSDDDIIRPPCLPRTPSTTQRTIRTVQKSGHMLHIRAPHTHTPVHMQSHPRAALAPGLSTTQITESNFVAVVHAVPALETNIALLVLDLTAHPAAGCRFVNASITLAFQPSNNDNNTTTRVQAPKVLGLAPQHSVGAWTPAQTGCIRAASFPATPVSPLDAAPLGTTTIEGSVRAGASKCVWTAEENSCSLRGIPAHLRLVAAIACPAQDADVCVRVDIRAEVGRGSVSVPVAAQHGGVVRVFSISGESGREGGKEVGWRGFLSGVTGCVPVESV